MAGGCLHLIRLPSSRTRKSPPNDHRSSSPRRKPPPAPTSKAWPFEEARRLIKRLERLPDGAEKTVLFETGYGPSGLPHIGTFGEVARTTMVRHAFELLTDGKRKTRLLCFSDDMDGMRKIPENVPDRKALEPYLQMPLTAVPDPFGGNYASFGDHNNAMLRRFLDTFGFDYEFASATEYYKAGRFDEVLLRAVERYDDIMAVMLPTLGAERQATYSPFLPISPTSGRVLYVPMKKVDAKAGTITFADEDGRDVTLPVTGGRVKLQWKPDFGMRWAALGVDFEMFGKDHQTNAPIYDRICEILGGVAPAALRLRALPRRQGREDLEVERQRPDHRRVADLRIAREPGALHVPEAAERQEALFRRHPARRRRVPAVPVRLSEPGCEAAARQSGLAYPRRRAARSRNCRSPSHCC